MNQCVKNHRLLLGKNNWLSNSTNCDKHFNIIVYFTLVTFIFNQMLKTYFWYEHIFDVL